MNYHVEYYFDIYVMKITRKGNNPIIKGEYK